MEEMLLLEAVEKYLRGEMSAEERSYFEEMRNKRPEVDQLVVEHAMFLQQLERFGEDKAFRQQAHAIHHQLLEQGAIKVEELKGTTKVVNILRKYRRTIAIAASIAGIVALFTSAMVGYYNNNQSNPDLVLLKKEVESLKKTARVLDTKIDKSNAGNIQNYRPAATEKTNGTGFLIDGKGYIVTNAHVLQKADSVYIENNDGLYIKATICYTNKNADIAILQLDPARFKSIDKLPYSIKKSSADLGEQIFTLGYPREEVVYGEGYLSAVTGYNGDTASFQITIPANPGNSGGPVINRNGEIIGVLSEKQAKAEGVAFAIKSNSIYKAVEELKKTEEHKFIKIATTSRLRGVDRVSQIKKVADCVFLVKTY